MLKVDMWAGDKGFSHALHCPRWKYVCCFLGHFCLTIHSHQGAMYLYCLSL